MTQRKITTIMAAIALSAPMMASGVAPAAPYSHDYLSPRGHGFANGVTNVVCVWVRDYRGNIYCVDNLGDPEHHVNPGK
jgi:hypothetical protein